MTTPLEPPTKAGILKQHPVLVIVGGTMAVVNGIMGLLCGWPIVHWTAAQQALVWGVLNPVLGIVTALVASQYTTPYDPDLANTSENAYLMRARIDELEANGAAPPPRPRASKRTPRSRA